MGMIIARAVLRIKWQNGEMKPFTNVSFPFLSFHSLIHSFLSLSVYLVPETDDTEAEDTEMGKKCFLPSTAASVLEGDRQTSRSFQRRTGAKSEESTRPGDTGRAKQIPRGGGSLLLFALYLITAVADSKQSLTG